MKRKPLLPLVVAALCLLVAYAIAEPASAAPATEAPACPAQAGG